MIELANNFEVENRSVTIPVWLAGEILRLRLPGVFAKSATTPFQMFATSFATLGLLPTDQEILPYLLGIWSDSLGEISNEHPNALTLDAATLRVQTPDELHERIDDFCGRLFGLRLVDHSSGVVQPFFDHEVIENAALHYRAALRPRREMQNCLLGIRVAKSDEATSCVPGMNDYPALKFSMRVWKGLSRMERAWLIALECAARWDFTWVREDGCVALDVNLSRESTLAETLKPLVSLGRKLVDHGWLLPAVDDSPMLFDHGAASGNLRLLWVLHPSRMILPKRVGHDAERVGHDAVVTQLPQESQKPEKPEKPQKPEKQVAQDVIASGSAIPDSLMSKMRLVAAEELQKIRAGGSGQYVQLKKRYLESLDPQGRQLISNLEKMLAPELMEEHLRHGLVRYMIEHPSAWQSASSSKPTH